MYELIQAGERTYYIDCPSKIGIYRMDETRVCLIDSGNDKDAGKKVWKILDANGWKLDRILNTHFHADHVGGNSLLQQRTGCKIYCAGMDRAFVEHPVLEPALLYGGSPYKELKNKFLCAQASQVEELTTEVLPEGMEMLQIDGHSFAMTAFRTPDDVWFVADSVTSEEVLNKYHVSFIYDVEAYLSSLEKLEKLEGKLFIPSHAQASQALSALIKINRDKVYKIRDLLKEICAEAVGNEAILKAVFDKYQLVMDENQYVLVGSTIRSYLSWMKGQGVLETAFAENRKYWKACVEKAPEEAGDPVGQPVDNKVNTDAGAVLKQVECFALDMDGTIYLGEQWIDGAKEFLAKIEDMGKQYVVLTNNSSKNPGVDVEKLKRMGLEVGLEKIVTSGQAAIYYLKKHFPEKRVFLLGNPMLQEEFREEGIALDDKNPEVVVTAFDTTLDYDKMCKVCDFVRTGLPYIATHPDYNCPTETGFIPDAGAIHAFIHASAGRYPDRIIGKPNGAIVDYLIDRIGVEREKVAMVGDRLYTDIAAGKKNGLKSVLVLSGEARLTDVVTSEVKPDLIFDSVKEMSAFI